VEVVCFAVIPVFAAIAWGVWLLVRVTQRDEARLCTLAQREALVVAERLRPATGKEWPNDPELWRSLLSPHMPRHLVARVDVERLVRELAESLPPPPFGEA